MWTYNFCFEVSVVRNKAVWRDAFEKHGWTIERTLSLSFSFSYAGYKLVTNMHVLVKDENIIASVL
jgi:hypothetical protein